MLQSPRVLILSPDRDHDGQVDFTLAFSPESDHLRHLYPQSVHVLVDVSKDEASRRRQVVEALGVASAEGPLDLVAFLCHGWRTGIQLGFSLSQVPALAAALAMAGTPQLAVVLYACSTAQDDDRTPGTGGDGGFADLLRDCMGRLMGRCGQPAVLAHVDGHTCAGDCTSNPFVRRMDAAGDMGGAGGDWLVEPHSPLWKRWTEALRDHKGSTLRFRFPLMSRAEVQDELAEPPPAGSAA